MWFVKYMCKYMGFWEKKKKNQNKKKRFSTLLQKSPKHTSRACEYANKIKWLQDRPHAVVHKGPPRSCTPLTRLAMAMMPRTRIRKMTPVVIPPASSGTNRSLFTSEEEGKSMEKKFTILD